MSRDLEEEHRLRVEQNLRELKADRELRRRSLDWMCDAGKRGYSYNFRWMGRPVIQYPQDLIALQELMWDIRPGVVIETGVAHGGSLVFHASMLELIGGDGAVVGVDIDIRSHNRAAIEAHPMARRITLVEGSSTDEATVARVRALASGRRPVMVLLDSNHTRDHVLRELELYAPLVTRGSYLVVFDTSIEDTPDGYYPDRPWGKLDNPKLAVREFLAGSTRFVVDEELESKLLVTACPEGYLRCVED